MKSAVFLASFILASDFSLRRERTVDSGKFICLPISVAPKPSSLRDFALAACNILLSSLAIPISVLN